MKTLDQLNCERCGYRWFQRTEKKPVKCPECQSRSWDKRPEVVIPNKEHGQPVEITQKAQFDQP